MVTNSVLGPSNCLRQGPYDNAQHDESLDMYYLLPEGVVVPLDVEQRDVVGLPLGVASAPFALISYATNYIPNDVIKAHLGSGITGARASVRRTRAGRARPCARRRGAPGGRTAGAAPRSGPGARTGAAGCSAPC